MKAKGGKKQVGSGLFISKKGKGLLRKRVGGLWGCPSWSGLVGALGRRHNADGAANVTVSLGRACSFPKKVKGCYAKGFGALWEHPLGESGCMQRSHRPEHKGELQEHKGGEQQGTVEVNF